MGDKDTFFGSKTRTVHCRGRVLDFQRPLIMGVLNLTPDSFYDGGKYGQEKLQAERVAHMLSEGADIIDIGAVSTRPGSKAITMEEEMERLIWPLQRLTKLFPEALFSIDTFRAQVAREAILHGGHIINDISGGNFDDNMFETIAELKVPYILMHIQGTPEHMQLAPLGAGVIGTVRNFFEDRVGTLQALGIEDIILDPGFGFGKTLKCNYTILKQLEKLRVGNLPLLGGISRKSMINKVINTNPAEALNGTTVLNTLALLNGANILRVHDVKEATEAVRIVSYYRELGDCEEG
jgi:dihydropteroate synthase